MRISGEIEKEIFVEKKKLLENKKEKLNQELALYNNEEKIQENDYKIILKKLNKILDQDFNYSTHDIPEEVIEEFVDEIIVCKDYFIWKLNFVDDEIKLKVEGRKNNSTVSLVDTPSLRNRSTGSDCQ